MGGAGSGVNHGDKREETGLQYYKLFHQHQTPMVELPFSLRAFSDDVSSRSKGRSAPIPLVGKYYLVPSPAG